MSQPPVSLGEPLLTFLITIALASGLYWTGRMVPFIRQNLHAGIAVIFLYGPVVTGWVTRRRFDFHEAGLRLQPLRLNALVLVGAVAVTFPLFVLGFFGFYDLVCGAARAATAAGAAVATVTRLVAPLCPSPGSWAGGWGDGARGGTSDYLAHAHLHLPASFLMLAANQVLVVALPEEMFFRGYLLGRLEARWPARHRLWGAPAGRALLVSAALFALGHFLVDFNAQRLAVFFPALVFGWMRARTGSVAPGIAYHALCNLLADVLHTSYFY